MRFSVKLRRWPRESCPYCNVGKKKKKHQDVESRRSQRLGRLKRVHPRTESDGEDILLELESPKISVVRPKISVVMTED